MMPRFARLAALVALLLLAAFRGATAEPVKIRIGWVVTPYEYVPIFFAKSGIAQHLGQSYSYEPIHYQSAALMIPALATGELDIAPLTVFSLAAAVQNAGLADLRIIADDYEDGVPGHHTDSFVVLNESPVKTVEDLRGRIVGSFGIGSVGDTAIRMMLRAHGIADNQYTSIEAAAPNMKAILLERKVDLVPIVGLFAFDPEIAAKTRPLFTQADALGRTASLLTARAAFIAAHRAALVDFCEDMVRSIRWYFDPAHHDEVVAILATFTKQPPERFSSWVFTDKDAYHDPNGTPDLDALQGPVDRLRKAGFLKADLDLHAYGDLSLVKEAAARVR
jgi:sulfonate transport system substrate-binding protein